MSGRNETQPLVLATGNPGKVAEYDELLRPLGMEVIGLGAFPGLELPEETGTTFEENASLKARSVARATGRLTLADDSGLCVDALGGSPGIYSARFGGPGLDDRGRCELLLARLAELPGAPSRAAHFVCVVALAKPDGETRTVRGEVQGAILEQLRGEGGFGYDPLFLVEALGQTYAELPESEKNLRSHRAMAVKQLPRLMKTWLYS